MNIPNQHGKEVSVTPAESGFHRNAILLVLFLLLPLAIFCGCSQASGRKSTPQKREKKPPAFSKKVILKAKTQGDKASLTWEIILPGDIKSLEIYRSSTDLGEISLDPVSYPISRFEIPDKSAKGTFIDQYPAHNCKYYYVLRVVMADSGEYFSSPAECSIPDRAVSTVSNPQLHIDKTRYILELIDGGKVIKRYPVALGRNPFTRKLNQDNSSTPEGIFRIVNLQPNATFYKAYDLDYPTPVDRFRYDFAVENNLIKPRDGFTPGIGGEIQIHSGPHIDWNWTFGCIATRKADIDQLFSLENLCSGVRVVITGGEITPEDLASIKKIRSTKEIKEIQKKLQKAGCKPGNADGSLGKQTSYALGRFQMKNDLPVTCQLDERTVGKLKEIEL